MISESVTLVTVSQQRYPSVLAPFLSSWTQAFCHGSLWQGHEMTLGELCHSLPCGDPASPKTLTPVPRSSSRLLEKTLQELLLLQSVTYPHLSLYPLLPNSPSKGNVG